MVQNKLERYYQYEEQQLREQKFRTKEQFRTKAFQNNIMKSKNKIFLLNCGPCSCLDPIPITKYFHTTSTLTSCCKTELSTAGSLARELKESPTNPRSSLISALFLQELSRQLCLFSAPSDIWDLGPWFFKLELPGLFGFLVGELF